MTVAQPIAAVWRCGAGCFFNAFSGELPRPIGVTPDGVVAREQYSLAGHAVGGRPHALGAPPGKDPPQEGQVDRDGSETCVFA